MLSIITPVFNGVEFIVNNLESINKLNIPYEHIIVDGGSTDGTVNILKSYTNIIIVHQNENTGMYGAIDIGFNQAKGNYVCWVNCDDLIIPYGYEEMYKYAIKKNLDLVCSNGIFDYIKENRKKVIRGTRFVKYFLTKSYFPFVQPSSIFTKKLYNDVKGFDYDHFRIAGDGDMYTRMALVKSAKFGYLNINSSIFRIHGDSLGDNNKELWHKEVSTKGYLNKNNFIDRILLKLCRLAHL